MSSLCCKLRRLWLTPRQSTTKLTIATASPSLHSLFKESDVDAMARTLKKRSESSSFRCKNILNVYPYAIHRLAKLKRFSAIEDILDTHKTYREITKEGYAARLISLYGRTGMFDHAHKLFDELPDLKCQRKTMSFNSLLGAALHSKEFQRAVEIFNKYPSELGFKLDAVSYNTVIQALGELGLLGEAVSMVDKMEMEGLEPDLVTFNALVTGAFATKGFSEGEKIWELMLEKKCDLVPDIKSYNAKLQGMFNDGMVVEAADLFHELRIMGLKPNAVTYSHLIKGFCDRGDLEEVKKWYKKLVDSVRFPTECTFETLVRPLCENRDFDLAFDLSKRMLRKFNMVDQDLLQMVVDNLVKDSKFEEAKTLVEIGGSNLYCQYKLVMPS